MYKLTDFELSKTEFRFKKDIYPLAKINQFRVKKLSILDNFWQILFWILLFSGFVWLVMSQLEESPLLLKLIASSLTVAGFVFGLTRCAKYALQIEFRHIDETGAQWVNVAKSWSTSDNKLFIQQVQIWKDWSRR
ncbi:hypothetical protein GTG28_07650 [Vibrio sp. OCN044]|uniref:Uncharacterized protein n=1 Tax=Vibrio tetraodonis subsp. pristinus TaxID=2695891 RepID=A0A6L8LSK0_9VIBR|nr:hypothetical protein [Vibrio tetraodonis]MYM59094.1 hypothetical protein [Vibrio tetraodonis subsp. pristinus]